MKNIAVIGATGLLGKAMMTCDDTVACGIRFEESHKFVDWFDEHNNIDTVWYVARACRKSGIRRDFSTFLLEKKAISNLLKSRARHCRMVFASTKVVYGLTDNDVCETSCQQVINQFRNIGKNWCLIKVSGSKNHITFINHLMAYIRLS